MANAQLDGLLINIDANIALMRRSLAQGVQETQKFERQVTKVTSNVDAAFSKMGKGLLAGLGVGLAIQVGKQFHDAAVAALSYADDLQDAADAAGVTTKTYQELAFAAAGVGVEQEKFTRVMGNFAVTMAEVRTQTGGFYNFLAQQAPELLKQLQAARSQSEAFAILADAVKNLESAEARALLAKQALGKEGVKLTGVLQGGAEGLRLSAEEAERLGIVLDQNTINAASKMEAEYRKAAATIDASFKRALISLAPVLVTVTGLAVKLADALARISQSTASAFEKPLMNDLANAKAELELVKKRIEDDKTGSSFFVPDMGAETRKGELTAMIAQIESDLRARRDAIKQIISTAEPTASLPEDFGLATVATPEQKAAIKELAKDTEEAKSALKSLNTEYLTATGQTLEAIRVKHDEELANFQAMLDNKLISEEQFATARDQLAATTATQIAEYQKEEAEAFKAAADQIAGAITGPIQNAFSEFVETGKVSFDGLIQSMLAGLANVIFELTVIKPLMESLSGGISGGLGGSGGIASLLAGGLAGFANGGSVTGGKPIVVGERGPELFVPNASGSVVPNHRMSSGGGNVVNIQYSIDARGADKGVEQRLAMLVMQQSEKTKADVMAGLDRRSRTIGVRR